MKIIAVIAAAGSSSRLGGEKNKLIMEIGGRRIFEICLLNLLKIEEIAQIIVAANPGIRTELRSIAEKSASSKTIFVDGGDTRSESVSRALDYADEADYVMIHDAARPLLPRHVAHKLMQSVKTADAAVPVLKSPDTLYSIEGTSVSCMDRNSIYRVQTPQIFNKNSISLIRHELKSGSKTYTDEASILIDKGMKIEFVEGSSYLHKITYESDLKYLQSMYETFLETEF